MLKALGRLWQRLVDWLNKLAGERSMEALRDETVESYQDALSNSMESMAQAGGNIGTMMLELSRAQQREKQLDADLRAYIRHNQGLQGDALTSFQRTLAAKTKVLAGARQIRLSLEDAVEKGVGRQEKAKFMVQDFRNQQLMAEARADQFVAEDQLADIEESLIRAQMAAAGVLGGTGVKDHTREMEERVARRRGRITGLEQFGEAVIQPTDTEIALTDDEQQILADAYRQAGVTQPTSESTQQSNQAS